MKFLLILIFLNSILFAEGEPSSPKEIFKLQRIPQGEILLTQANAFYEDKNYHAAIEKLIDFLILYPSHSSRTKAMKLLSQSYQFNDEWEKSVEIDMKIYRENPSIEDGLTSYLEAAKKLCKMGRENKAKTILEKLKTQMYSNKVAKEAEIELVQLEILEKNQ